MKKAFIYIHSLATKEVSVMVLNAKEMQFFGYTTLTNLPLSLNEYELMVSIPFTDLLITEVKLPKLNEKQLLQALPFSLEDQLIEEVSNLHFAFGSYNEVQESFPVVVINKEKLTAYLQLFKELQLTPSQILPNLLLLPYHEEEWPLLVDKDNCLLRTGYFQGLSCAKNEVDTFLSFALKKPQKLVCNYFTKPENLELTKAFVLEENAKTMEACLTMMYKIAEHPNVINLLQGAFKPKNSRKLTKSWRKTAYLLGAIIVMLAIQTLGSFVLLQYEQNKLNNEITLLYKKYFPNEKMILNPRLHMEQKLKALELNKQQNLFLTQLNLAGSVLQKFSGIHLLAFTFQEKQLNLSLIAETFDQLDALVVALKKAGLRVEEKNATSSENKIKATILIKGLNA